MNRVDDLITLTKAAVILETTSIFFSSNQEESLTSYANKYEKSTYCLIMRSNHNLTYCSFKNSGNPNLLIAKNGEKRMCEQPNGIEFKYQFVDCFCIMFKINFIGKVCELNGQNLNQLEKSVKFNQKFKASQRMSSFAKKPLKSHSKEHFLKLKEHKV